MGLNKNNKDEALVGIKVEVFSGGVITKCIVMNMEWRFDEQMRRILDRGWRNRIKKLVGWTR